MKTTPLCVRKLIPALLHAHLKHGQVSDGVGWGEGTFGEQNEDTSMGKDAVCLISVSGNRVGRWMPELGGGGAGGERDRIPRLGAGNIGFFSRGTIIFQLQKFSADTDICTFKKKKRNVVIKKNNDSRHPSV